MEAFSVGLGIRSIHLGTFGDWATVLCNCFHAL